MHKLHVFSPQLYHGTKNSRPYFEGWYFKHTSDKKSFSMAVIPGVSRAKFKEDDHCFVQIMLNDKSYYIRYSYEKFRYNKKAFEVYIDKNYFSMDRIHLDIDNKDIKIKADIKYDNLTLLESSPFSPSIMGFFSYFPSMQCNHGVLSLRHNVSGSVKVNDAKIDLDGFTGYIEKDWGEAFPDNWIWLQCSSSISSNESISFMCSIANIPFGLLKFTGLIAVIGIGSKQYRFATYNNSRVKSITKKENRVDILIEKFNQTLQIIAETQKGSLLKAPSKTGMKRDIYESLNATISICLTQNEKTVYEGTHTNGGMEISEIENC